MRFAKDEVYHIYVRGIEDRNIFMKSSDYERFLLGLREFNTIRSVELRRIKENTDQRGPQEYSWQQKRELASILSYILMQNHLHLLVFCKNPKDLSRFLMKIFMGYTKYFNTKYDRSGVLFQSRSKSKHITNEGQLEVIIRYILLNALDYDFPEWRAGKIKNLNVAKKALLDYPWSGLQEMLGERDYEIIDKNLIKNFIPDSGAFLKSLLEWSSRDFEGSSGLFIE